MEWNGTGWDGMGWELGQDPELQIGTGIDEIHVRI